MMKRHNTLNWRPSRRAASGFTMIELVVAVVLMGILSVVVMSRLLAPSAFNAVAARDAFINTARAAQQMSLGRDDVKLEIQSTASQWVFVAGSGSTPLRTVTTGRPSALLSTGSANASGVCGSGFNTPVTGGDFLVNFDSLGNVTSFTHSAGTETMSSSFVGIRLCVNADPALAVCLSPAGFAHAGACQ